MAVQHLVQGLKVTAVILDGDGISILFSFTRSYFHVLTDRPFDLIAFLKTILPRKRVAELFDVAFWQQTQLRIRAGETPFVFPYAPQYRLP